MKIIKILGILCISAVAVFGAKQAWADQGAYVSVGGVAIDTDITDHTGFMVSVGVSFNDFLAAEVSTLISSTTDDYYGIDVDINRFFSAALIGKLPLTNSLSLYGKAMYSNAEVEASYMGYSESDSETDSGYGFGVMYDLAEAWTVRAEYTKPYEDIDFMSISLSANF